MHTRRLARSILFGGSLFLLTQSLAAAQITPNALADLSDPRNIKASGVDPQVAPTPRELSELIDRVVKREHEQVVSFDSYSPIIETYIQQVRIDAAAGAVPKGDHYFIGQADFHGRLRVHPMIGDRKFSLTWSFAPTGFLQMIYVDRGEFDKAHYQFKYVKKEFLGEVRCIALDVIRAPKVRGPRFEGRIWVEDQEFNIVRINGAYTPTASFSLKTFQDEYYLHFDSWRTNTAPGLWLPSYIFSQEIHPTSRFNNPSYKSATHLWGYKLTQSSREEELNRLLVESADPIKDDAAQHDRSPLEAQREWRHEAENNVLDLLERDGLLAPRGEVDKLLNTVVTNIELTNNFDEQIDLRCRVLLTTDLEMFSVGNTVVISRGLIDVVPNEETLAAVLAQGMADALLPKPRQDQYAFNDLLRLSPVQVLKRLSFEEEKTEVIQNSQKAMELLKKSPYAGKLGSAGLFMAQLHLQAKELKQLISPRLGNAVYFAAELLQSAPALQPESKGQIAALPLGSRIKIDPWTSGISLMKSKPVSLLSARDKMPFAVTPLVPYLTRHMEATAVPADSGAAVALD